VKIFRVGAVTILKDVLILKHRVMKTFGNEGSAISHCEFLRFMSDTGYFILQEIYRCEI
jgi:hypothetical protein